MDTAIDSNILIYAHLPSLSEHVQARQTVEAILADPSARVLLTVGILAEVVHVVTDSRRFQPALSIHQATALARTYLNRTNVAVMPTEDIDLQNALALMDRYRLGRGRISDTLLAAVLQRHGVVRLLTRNLADFQIFPFLRPENPLCA